MPTTFEPEPNTNQTRIIIIVQYLDDNGNLANDLHISMLDNILDVLILDLVRAVIRQMEIHDS